MSFQISKNDRILIKELLQRPEFEAEPPVLIDIGASGALHPEWQWLAPYSICLAFDADGREMREVKNGAYRRLVIYPCIVSDKEQTEQDFYLTKSPFCSSTLEPDFARLQPWAFSELFSVTAQTKIASRSLATALAEQKIGYIDWFKTDSQGTDLRLFNSLPPEVLRRICTAEFEPGILDAYKGEDKLHAVLRFMDDQPFWLARMDIRGTQRISTQATNYLKSQFKKNITGVLPECPGWASVVYLHSMASVHEFSLRNWLLLWMITFMKGQTGFAIDLALQGRSLFPHSEFDRLLQHCSRSFPDRLSASLRRLKRQSPGHAL